MSKKLKYLDVKCNYTITIIYSMQDLTSQEYF